MSANDIAMLSAQGCTLDDIEFPCWVSIKYDGIRALTKNGKGMSRANIPLPNRCLQEMLSHPTLDMLDGEVILGNPDDPDCYNRTQSAAMRGDGDHAFHYYVFDDLTIPELSFEHRQQRLDKRALPAWCMRVTQHLVHNRAELEAMYTSLVDAGHEGVITRNGNSPYKRGRGTKVAQDMIKLKPREDSEAVIVDVLELERNTNEAKVGERGQTKRSSHQAGKVAGGTLGRFLVRDIKTGVEFYIGTFKGLKAKDKGQIWEDRFDYIGRTCTYSFCPVGVKDKPRQPSWKGWRTSVDL